MMAGVEGLGSGVWGLGKCWEMEHTTLVDEGVLHVSAF